MYNEAIISVRNVSKLYGKNKSEALKLMKQGKTKAEIQEKLGTTVALSDVSFDVKEGQIFVIIGLSGSGKSTMIRCLNMLHKPTSGIVKFKGQEIGKLNKKQLLSYRREKISMVFQNFGLMDHRNVLSNVVYGLEIRKVPKEERIKKAIELISMVGLDGWEYSSIDSLSGGMKQRVGIARALANDPEILLMDEPFSALDPMVRRDMQFELLSIQRKLNKTVIFITHDVNEAFKLGDTVAIMKDGKIIQMDTPENMFANPANDYVRNFIDSADKTQVLSAKHVMVTPSCIVKPKDSVSHALKEMRFNGFSSAFAVDEAMRFLGVLTLEGALRAKQEKNTKIEDYIEKNVESVYKDVFVSEVIPRAASSKFPIAVVDAENKLLGIISKASVLTSLAQFENDEENNEE